MSTSSVENVGPSDDAGPEELLVASERSLASGDHATGAGQAREALAQAERVDERALQAQALSLLGVHEFRLGEHEASLAALHSAQALFTGLGDLRGVSSAHNGMVLAYDALGLPEDALEHAGRSLEAAKQGGDPLTLAWAYNRAGLGHASVGNVAEGIVSLEFALNLAREIGDDEAIFAALNNLIEDLNTLARELRDEGAEEEACARIARALELAPEALELARASDNPYEEAIVLVTYGETLCLAADFDRARAALRRAEGLARRGGYRPLMLEAREIHARLQLERGDSRGAVAQYRALLEDADRERDQLLLVRVHLGLCQAYKQLGDYRAALQHHERFHDLERRQQSQLATTRARVLSTHLELDRAQQQARRATLEVELERSRTRELEAQANALREERELLSRRADQDGLTGLWNRRHIERELPRLVREAAVRAQPLAVAYVDADRFKSINDRFGHLRGDDVLRRLADLFIANVRPSDVVARIGGEEFVVLLPRADAGAARLLGERLCDAVREARWKDIIDGYRPTVSVGVAAAAPAMGPSRDVDRQVAELLGRADGALYAAKRAGRDRVMLADP